MHVCLQINKNTNGMEPIRSRETFSKKKGLIVLFCIIMSLFYTHSFLLFFSHFFFCKCLEQQQICVYVLVCICECCFMFILNEGKQQTNIENWLLGFKKKKKENEKSNTPQKNDTKEKRIERIHGMACQMQKTFTGVLYEKQSMIIVVENFKQFASFSFLFFC